MYAGCRGAWVARSRRRSAFSSANANLHPKLSTLTHTPLPLNPSQPEALPAPDHSNPSLTPRCRANMAHTRQSSEYGTYSQGLILAWVALLGLLLDGLPLGTHYGSQVLGLKHVSGVIDAGLVGGAPREQKMLKGHLPRVIYYLGRAEQAALGLLCGSEAGS